MEYLQYRTISLRQLSKSISFKPCYKWNTFNTGEIEVDRINDTYIVLNLVISGIPSIRQRCRSRRSREIKVLNLVISGIPSIQKEIVYAFSEEGYGFKPCYKWNTFNT